MLPPPPSPSLPCSTPAVTLVSGGASSCGTATRRPSCCGAAAASDARCGLQRRRGRSSRCGVGNDDVPGRHEHAEPRCSSARHGTIERPLCRAWAGMPARRHYVAPCPAVLGPCRARTARLAMYIPRGPGLMPSSCGPAEDTSCPVAGGAGCAFFESAPCRAQAKLHWSAGTCHFTCHPCTCTSASLFLMYSLFKSSWRRTVTCFWFFEPNTSFGC
ncbi:hypothetical protein C2845_PM01G21600 [Panicum miliaceum]|uniref:Uncharacterized protein n=1 Tax=Panicum miliaceum TaxID=4540 RepID=A0A3L6TIX0_PANMI|nr:hypothetical protein C2845_PM01G21600 [Panicum miliaceum]